MECEGYTVLPTRDIGGAVDLLKVCRPDLLITRTYVESLPGHDAAIFLREHFLTMKVLILGGLLHDDRLQYREALKGFAIFPKPYAAAELLQKVRDVVSEPRD